MLGIYDKKKLNIFNVGNSKQNYSKKSIVKSIGKYIPLRKITYSNQKESDKRDYKVNFTKINTQLNFRTKYDIDFGINEIIKFLKKNKNKNFFNKKYSNT